MAIELCRCFYDHLSISIGISSLNCYHCNVTQDEKTRACESVDVPDEVVIDHFMHRDF